MKLDLNLKAFAYPASNLSEDEPVSPCLCSFVYRWDDFKYATLLLVLNIPTAHGTEDFEFVLQYDADNLKPTHVRLANGKERLEQPQLDELVGKGMKDRDIKTLHLSTEQLPPAWCPAGITTFSPKPGLEPAFQRLVKLAKETSIHVVFDFKQLRKECRGSFKAFSKAARGLSGYHVDASLEERGLRRARWEVFAPTEVAGAPPTYTDSHTRKRPRQGKSPKTFPFLTSSTDAYRRLQPTSSAQLLGSHNAADSQIVHDRKDQFNQSRDYSCRSATCAVVVSGLQTSSQYYERNCRGPTCCAHGEAQCFAC